MTEIDQRGVASLILNRPEVHNAFDDVLIGLGAYSVNFEDHPSMVLVGDGRSGQWSRFFGFPSPDRIMQQVNALQSARQGAAGG